jgi:hypothetical protein
MKTLFTNNNIGELALSISLPAVALLASIAFGTPAQACSASAINCNSGGTTSPLQQVRLSGVANGVSGGFSILEASDPSRIRNTGEAIRTGRETVSLNVNASGNGCGLPDCSSVSWTAEIDAKEDVQTLNVIEIKPGHGNFYSEFAGGGHALAEARLQFGSGSK